MSRFGTLYLFTCGIQRVAGRFAGHTGAVAPPLDVTGQPAKGRVRGEREQCVCARLSDSKRGRVRIVLAAFGGKYRSNLLGCEPTFFEVVTYSCRGVATFKPFVNQCAGIGVIIDIAGNLGCLNGFVNALGVKAAVDQFVTESLRRLWRACRGAPNKP
jgi:hypothetical protein